MWSPTFGARLGPATAPCPTASCPMESTMISPAPRRRTPSLLVLAVAVALAGGSGVSFTTFAAPQADAVKAESKAQTLNRLYGEYWEELLRLNPIQATFQGDPRYNDQLPNFLTEESRRENHAFTERWLRKIETIGDKGLSGQDLLSYEIFVKNAKDSLEGEKFPGYLMPIDQFTNLGGLAAQLGSGTNAQPFKTVKDYDDWRARGSKLAPIFDQAIANMREGMRTGVVQPKALMTKVLPQFDALIADKAEDTLFWGPIKKLPATFSDADKARITAEYRTMIEKEIMPSYRRMREFIAKEYLPACRDTAGMGDLPNGQAWYAFNAYQSTSTRLQPAEIHQIGLGEVARLHGEIRKVMEQVGFKGSMQDFFKYVNTDKKFEFASEDALLAHYRSIEATLEPGLNRMFNLKPQAGFEIRPIEAFRAKSAAGGQYQSPSEDGSRPGIFYVNTYELPSRKTWDSEDLFLHEAKPGHHFQLAIQQELKGLPNFRRFGGETAYIEGWGLYSETIGKELGVLNDPYMYFGMLQNELWRSIRLVVDTGFHSKGWTREQVIQYMLENSATSETDAVAEAERYMAIPGQALAYKTGQLKITELRARAEKALGTRFDIKAFHDEVLKDGSVPLDVLDAKIERWISGQKKT
ncbi:MAG: DUF885 family protein [Xanthomonadales bacterium]|nr:DUF885 family protein [Xanthomonadales bacterium]